MNSYKEKFFFFDFGPDSRNKPSNILFDDGSATIKLKCSGSEMMVFVKYFGLIIGYYVPEDDRVWDLYVLLRKLLDKLMVRSFSKDEIAPLRHLIELFLWTFSDVVKENLKPKFHFLLHYPDMFLKFGPLVSLSTMRFEAKHRVSKIAARAACTRVNICKTVATRNQLTLHHYLSSTSKVEGIVFGRKSSIFTEHSEFLKSKFNVSSPDLFVSITWLETKNCKIEKSSILMKDLCMDTMLPIFVQVEDIFVCNGQVFFICSKLQCQYFIDHFQAYKVVQQTEEKEYLSLENLFSPIPHTLSIQPNFTFYVTLRCNIE